jgi:hypothetical protein
MFCFPNCKFVVKTLTSSFWAARVGDCGISRTFSTVPGAINVAEGIPELRNAGSHESPTRNHLGVAEAAEKLMAWCQYNISRTRMKWISVELIQTGSKVRTRYAPSLRIVTSSSNLVSMEVLRWKEYSETVPDRRYRQSRASLPSANLPGSQSPIRSPSHK